MGCCDRQLSGGGPSTAEAPSQVSWAEAVSCGEAAVTKCEPSQPPQEMLPEGELVILTAGGVLTVSP
jgi:hypothetical protein